MSLTALHAHYFEDLHTLDSFCLPKETRFKQRDTLTNAYAKLLATALNQAVESAHVCFQTDLAENIAYELQHF